MMSLPFSVLSFNLDVRLDLHLPILLFLVVHSFYVSCWCWFHISFKDHPELWWPCLQSNHICSYESTKDIFNTCVINIQKVTFMLISCTPRVGSNCCICWHFNLCSIGTKPILDSSMNIFDSDSANKWWSLPLDSFRAISAHPWTLYETASLRFRLFYQLPVLTPVLNALLLSCVSCEILFTWIFEYMSFPVGHPQSGFRRLHTQLEPAGILSLR